jgi:hypothetical protein
MLSMLVACGGAGKTGAPASDAGPPADGPPTGGTPAPLDGPAAPADSGAVGSAPEASAPDSAISAPDAPGPDSPGTDAGSCPPLESVRVPADGTAAAFKTALDRDATYLLKAEGQVQAGGQAIDAEFAVAAGAGSDVVGGVDVGVDVGLLWPNRPFRFTQMQPGPARMKWNPAPQIDASNTVTPGAHFRADGNYYMVVIGSGRPLSPRLVLPPGANASGAITVSLYALSPPPPARYQAVHSTTPAPPPAPRICGQPLDSIDVPVASPTAVAGTYLTDANKLYLLQASGTGPVGAAGLGDGDAEYMDFGADVTVNGFNDGEACADFGLGVDELMVGHCSNNNLCLHRKNWWGTVGIDARTTTQFDSPSYRNDHIYYLVYPGTGKPISFLYFDSGYGDNKPASDVLVRVFPMP